MARPFLHRSLEQFTARAFTTSATRTSRSFASTSTCARCLRLQLRQPIPRNVSRRHASTRADDPAFTSPLDRPARYVSLRRKHSWGLIVLAIIPIAAFGLGTWQIQRLQWKTTLIARLEDNLVRPPLPLPPQVDPSAAETFDHRRVTARGVFDHSREMMVAPRMKDGEEGAVLVTPLVRRGVRQVGLGDEKEVGTPEQQVEERSGWSRYFGWLGSWAGGGWFGAAQGATGEVEDDADTILVIRGWVPKAKKSQAARPEGLPTGVVQVEGLLRRPFKKNMFTPTNKPGENKWYFLDLGEMSEWAGTSPVWIEETMEPTTIESYNRMQKGKPLGRVAGVELNNHHMQYIVTWYALSICTTIMFYILVKRPPTEIQKKVRATQNWMV